MNIEISIYFLLETLKTLEEARDLLRRHAEFNGDDLSGATNKINGVAIALNQKLSNYQ